MSENDYSINPTNDQRHQLLLEALSRTGRAEDYENILELLSPPPDLTRSLAPAAFRNTRIGIIGAGLAGLSAAYELRKLGADITIYDGQKDRVGGRVYTLYFDRSGRYYGEFGAMRIPISHETTWHYINLFHLGTEALSSPQSNNFIFAHDVRIRRSGQNITESLYPYYDLTETERNTPWNVLSDYAMNAFLNQMTPEIRTEILKILPAYSGEYAAITRLSNRQVFEMLGLSQGAIELLSAVDPFSGALLGISYDETLSSNYSLDFMNTYRITEGMVHLPLAFYNSLTAKEPPEIDFPSYFLGKVDIRLGQPVKGISKSQNSKGVDLCYKNQKGTEAIESYDYVICAIPFSTLREIQTVPYFSNKKMQAIKEYNYIDAQKTLFLCKRRFWEEEKEYGRMNGGISFTDLPIQSIIYPPDHLRCENRENCSPNTPGVLTASYNLGQDANRVSSQTITHRFDLIKRNVEAVHGLPPGYLDALVDGYKTVHWNTEHWARGAFAAGNPGQKLLFAYDMQRPEYDERLYFAGEHVSTKQGWLQGALHSGKAVANMVIENFSRSY
jgi:monoamine oxidase